MNAVEANVDGLVGPTHNYAGLSVGNVASQTHLGAQSNPRGAALQGLRKMKRLADLGVPQFVLPPHQRPRLDLLRNLGFNGTDAQVNAAAWKAAPALAGAAWSASAMWAANAATVTPSADSADGRVHFTPANLLTTLHRSLEARATAQSLRRMFPDPRHFVVHDPLPAQPHFADEGAANQFRLCAEHGGPGVNLMVWGRDAYAPWIGRYPARQTRQACEAVVRRHGAARAVFPRQAAVAIEAGAFHNDVVCVGALRCLLYHRQAFEDPAAMQDAVRSAAGEAFEPEFIEIAAEELSLGEAVSSYLFNGQLLQLPGRDRLSLLAPMEAYDNPAARRVAERLATANGPIGDIEYIDLGESMRNGGGPACLRLRVVLRPEELAATAPEYRLDDDLYKRLNDWILSHYRDRLTPQDLSGPEMIEESRLALEALDAVWTSRRRLAA